MRKTATILMLGITLTCTGALAADEFRIGGNDSGVCWGQSRIFN